MKIKFGFKLTASLVSLFISFILCAFSNKSKYCLFFGLLTLALAVVLFVMHKIDDINKRIKALDIRLEEESITEEECYVEKKLIKKEKKKLTISFLAFAILLVVVAIISLWN